MERQESQPVIRLEGEFTLTSATQLKRLLLQGLASGNDLRLDLEQAGEIDIPVMQLLWAAGREADRKGTGISIQVPDAAATAAREAGFERFPGLTVPE
jgi:ABC-type transporter Mla MlaB component